VWPVPVAQALPRPQPTFSFQNLVFLEFIWIFSGRNHFKINISLHFESKSYQINSIKSCSSRSFPTTPKGTFQFLRNFQVRFSSIFQWRNHSIFKNFCTASPNVMEPVLIESFPTTPRTRSEAFKFGGSHNYITEQNKLPSFIDRWFIRVGLDRATLDFIKL
jgi:hypothetical protein